MSGRRLAIALLAAAIALTACGKEGERERAPGPPEPVLTPDSVRKGAKVERKQRAEERRKARVVEIDTPGADQGGGSGGRRDAPSPGAPTDSEVKAELKKARAELKDFRSYLSTASLQTGPRARVLRDGTAQAPEGAPEPVKRVILAANEIAKFPYKWGGGHGTWRDDGYDCSGSVSFALAGANLLDRPLASGGFTDFGAEGPGKWITIYTNPGHMFMVVAGLRFDTSGRGRDGTRWQEGGRPGNGYVVRHPPGL